MRSLGDRVLRSPGIEELPIFRFLLLIVPPWPKLVFAILDIVLESRRSYQMLKADLRFSDIFVSSLAGICSGGAPTPA